MDSRKKRFRYKLGRASVAERIKLPAIVTIMAIIRLTSIQPLKSRNSFSAMCAPASSSRYEIPGQLQQLLLDFTVSCLVERPADLVEFAADYFAQMRHRQQDQLSGQRRSTNATGSGATPGGLAAAVHGNGHGLESDDSMLTDESDEPSPGKPVSSQFNLVPS